MGSSYVLRDYILSKYGLQALVVVLAGCAGMANSQGWTLLWPTFIALACVAELGFLTWSVLEADVSVGSLRPLTRAQTQVVQALGSALWDRWEFDQWSRTCSVALSHLEKGARATLGLPGATHQVTANLMLALPYVDELTATERRKGIQALLNAELLDLYGGQANSGMRLDLCSPADQVRRELLTIHTGLLQNAPPLVLRQHRQSSRVTFGAARAVENCASRPPPADEAYEFWERADHVADTGRIPPGPAEDPAMTHLREHASTHLKRLHIRSFVSMALVHSGEVVGVVNINSSKEQFFRSPKRQALFIAFAEPILAVLGFLVFVYRERYEDWAATAVTLPQSSEMR